MRRKYITFNLTALYRFHDCGRGHVLPSLSGGIDIAEAAQLTGRTISSLAAEWRRECGWAIANIGRLLQAWDRLPLAERIAIASEVVGRPLTPRTGARELT